MSQRKEIARADRVLHGLWRIRLPLPWPGVPHCNAWAIAAGSGIVLVDTGIGGPGALAQLEFGLREAGLRLEHVRLIVCTHAHSDHYGLAGPIIDAAGCELWMHPNHAHMTAHVDDPDRMLDRRIEIARQSGVPEEIIANAYEQRRGQPMGVERVVLPDRDLVPGVEVETDLGRWQVYETPGHAPSHVCLHQPDRGLLLSGDHLLGRISLYYDYGYTPDPAGEFLESLDVVDRLDSQLCLAGHARPFREVDRKIAATRGTVLDRIERVRACLDGVPKTPFDIVPEFLGDPAPSPMMLNWGLNEVLVYLGHLKTRDHAHLHEDGGEVATWTR
jgi:glyoxylase-like metal-dependent hydrolase (beta-lactamase superfamily II)